MRRRVKAGHLHKKCSDVSSSSWHEGQVGDVIIGSTRSGGRSVL